MRRSVTLDEDNAVADAEAGAAVIIAGILRDRWERADTLGVAVGLVEGVVAAQRELLKLQG